MSNIALLEVLPPANNSVFEPYFANNVELLFNISSPSSSNDTCVAIEAEASANDAEASDNDADDNDNDDDALNNDAVCADADKFALFAKSRANICEPLDAKSTLVVIKDADATNSADADANTNDELNFENTCEPLAANEADDLASDADTNSDAVCADADVFALTANSKALT